jgi:dUTP pyrophosphatase
MSLVLQIMRLDPRASVPAYQTEHAAGLDLALCLPRGEFSAEVVRVDPAHRGGRILRLPTGLGCAIPVGYEGQVRPRSGLATKFGLTLPNAPGTIDSDYRGELLVPMINLGPEPVELRHGDRIAQLVIAPVARVLVDEVRSLDETARGSGGFGSTGGVG